MNIFSMALAFLYSLYLCAVINKTVDISFQEPDLEGQGRTNFCYKKVMIALIGRNALFGVLHFAFLNILDVLYGPMSWETFILITLWLGASNGVFIGCIVGFLAASFCSMGARYGSKEAKISGCLAVFAFLGAWFYYFFPEIG